MIVKQSVKTGILLFSVFLFAACPVKKEIVISGKTMGTTYHVKVIAGYFQSASDLKKKIDQRMDEINASMSTFIKDSEISRFNAVKSIEEKFYVSEDFFRVMTVAEKLYRLSDGAWDGTVNPLVNLWGFGSLSEKNKIPDPEEISKLLSEVGFDQIEISESRYLKKKKPSVSLDLSSIAKGYAVDEVAEVIRKNGTKSFLVEIGGEVYASGLRKDGKHWRVGINRPRPGAPVDQVYKTIRLQDRALATSGDYRNYFEQNNVRYSHVLDPRTGYPVKNGIVSVSVAATTCTFADGLATALMVLGYEKGLDLVAQLDNTDCLMVVQQKDGSLRDYPSKGFVTDN